MENSSNNPALAARSAGASAFAIKGAPGGSRVVVSVTAEPGQVVTAGQAVLKLARSGEKEVVVNAPESQVGRFKVGQAVAVSLWADPSNVLPGRVREIAGGADAVTRTYAVRVSVPTAPASAQLGMTASVLFGSTTDPSLVLLPLTALARDGSNAVVWVVDPKSSKVKMRQVSVGQFREDGVTVTAGLQPGDVVVTAGVHKLKPDQLVRIAQGAPGAAADNAVIAR